MQLNATRVYIWWLRKILISCVNSAGNNRKCSTIYPKNNHLQGVFFLIFSNFPGTAGLVVLGTSFVAGVNCVFSPDLSEEAVSECYMCFEEEIASLELGHSPGVQCKLGPGQLGSRGPTVRPKKCLSGAQIALNLRWIVPLKLSFRCVWPQDGHLCPF